MTEMQLILERMERIESLVVGLAEKQRVQEFYTVEEFAKIVGRSCFTCREWCRHRRINAQKRSSGRGAFTSWVISHDELLRYQRDGLLAMNDGF